MTFSCSRATAEIFVPDQSDVAHALARTTHLGIGAHPDDLEIFAIEGILQCFQQDAAWFSGVVVTDGAGSPRHGRYRGHTDERMRQVRRREQKKAAVLGDYSVQVLLDHSSQAVKQADRSVVEDLKRLLEATQATVVYTHSLADKHDTHVATALRVVQAFRELATDQRPARLLGCEVWRDLDWLSEGQKVEMKLDGQEHLQQALLGVFDSQIAGGKRYDRAAIGRRQAHATFAQTHAVDDAGGRVYAMDLTPLVLDKHLDPARYCLELIDGFRADVEHRIARLSRT
ncbi:MAG TPA: PIG-L family deacetylase [Polyangiaceae bacterium]|nr:PIG-L family deacetylase [Polyangiaceae bacterium]